MYPVFVRPAKPEDWNIFQTWMIANPENGLDPDILKYNSTSIRCAFDAEGPIAFLPVQRPLHLESLAFRPGITEAQQAAVLRSFLQDVVTAAHVEQSGEIYFLASEPSVPQFAERYGFEEMPWKVYRLKIRKLEGPDASREGDRGAELPLGAASGSPYSAGSERPN